MPDKNAIRLRDVSLIAFDLNGTLVVREEESFDRCFIECVNEWLGRWDAEERERAPMLMLGRYKEERAKQLSGGKKPPDEGDFGAAGREWLKRAIRGFPLPDDERVLKAIQARIKELQTKRKKWNEGAEQALQWASRHAEVAIVTDMSRRRALEVWRALGMNRYVKESRVFAPAARAKPSPKAGGKMYESVARALGVKPERCVMVGDSYRRDVEGARKAGWRAVWLKPAHRRPSSAAARGVPAIASLKHLSRCFE